MGYYAAIKLMFLEKLNDVGKKQMQSCIFYLLPDIEL